MMKPTEDTNRSVSLNFDAQALHNQEEAEYEREEQQRQQELRDLLTTAFDCDFTDEDDDDGSGESQGVISSDDSPTTETPQNAAIWGTNGGGLPEHEHVYHGMPLQQTSTPMAGIQQVPPLATPAPTPFTHPHLQHAPGPPNLHYPQYQYPTHDIGPNHQALAPNNWSAQHTQSTDQGFSHAHAQFKPLAYGLREEAEGGNAHTNDNLYDTNRQVHAKMHGHFYGNQDFHPQAQGGAVQGRGAGIYGAMSQDQKEDAFMSHPVKQHRLTMNNDPPVTQANTVAVMSRGGLAEDRVDNLDGYRVTFRGQAPVQSETDHQLPNTAENVQYSNQGRGHKAEHDTLQKEFLGQGGAPDNRQLNQLQILYDARGRKIEELTQEINALREDSDREIRILKHGLALTQGERDGMDGSLQQSQTLLAEAQRKEADLQGKNHALEAQVLALQQGKEEVVKKLQTAESTIESLNAQLCELEKSESLSRARDHHNNIVTSMQHKHEAEILDLKEKLDRSNRINQEKSDEIYELNNRVKHLLKEMEEKQIERADTINRLSKSLENSQKQCEQMLEAGTGQELSKIKVQLQEVIAGKSIAEDMNNALTGELQELKEQVMMYESASHFGILPGGSTAGATQLGGTTFTPRVGAADDSYSQLNIKSNKGAAHEETGSNPTTPRSNVGDGSQSSDETLNGLKKELERCLTMYRHKRQQVTNLQEELRKTRYSLDEMTLKLEDAQKQTVDSMRKLSEYETEVGPLGSNPGQETVPERRLKRQVDFLTRDKKLLEEEVQELMGRIEEIAASEERLKDANLELGHQMAQMVKEYDEDKRQALEQCESTVLEHHERVKAQLDADLRNEFTQEKETIAKEYEQKISELNSDLDKMNAELLEVKDLYVTVCQAKENLLESNEKLLQEKVEDKINELMDQLQKQKEEDIKKLKETWSINNDSAIAAAKEKWMKDQEEEMQKEIDIKVELSKTSWLREYAGAKETAVKIALMDAEAKWKTKTEEEMKEKLAHALQEAKEAWESEKQKEIKEEMEKVEKSVKEKVQMEKESLVSKKIEETHNVWREAELTAALAEEKARYEEKLAECIEEAKQTWRESELMPALKEAKELANKALSAQDPEDLKTEVASMLTEAKALWLEEQRKQVEATVRQVEQAAASQARTQIDEATSRLKEELTVLQTAKVQLEGDLSNMHTMIAEEKATVISTKDAERRKAVLTAQDQCEQDYRAFLDEHQDTLNKALKTAREEYTKEKAELERKHNEEIQAYKDREAKNNQADVQLSKDQGDLKEKWRQKIQEMAAHHAEEKENLMRSHRENLLKALEEARLRWQQKYEEALGENASLIRDKEAAWEEERNMLQNEIESLKSASHYQYDIARLQADMEKANEMKFTQLKSAHQLELQTVSGELRKQLDVRTAEMERLSEEVRACVAGLEEAQRVAGEEAQELKTAIIERDGEIARLKAELTASGQRVEQCESMNTDVIRKLEHMQIQTDKIERDKNETEKDLTEMNDSYHDLVEKLQRAEKKVKNIEIQAHKHIAVVQESMEREHSVAMEKMKAKMVELRSSHVIAVDNLRKQHVNEKKEWKKMMEQLKLEQSKDMSDEADSDMSKRYLKTLTRMRAEVLRHVKESNARAAETVREQIVKERQNTARRLRKYYMKCLNHLLDAENQNMTREEKLAYMEHALEYIPSRDTSQLTSRSSGRSNTPDDLTPRNTTTSNTFNSSTNLTPKTNQATKSRTEYHSPNRVKHSVSDSKIKEQLAGALTRVKTREDLASKAEQYRFTNKNDTRQYKSKFDYKATGSDNSKVDVPRLDLAQGGQNPTNTPFGDHANLTSLRQTAPRRTRAVQLMPWESENSSSDNAQMNGHYSKTSRPNRREKHVVLDDSAGSGKDNSDVTPGRSKYNLSSKSADNFSIEKPRSGLTRSRISDESYEMDMEMPSIYKTQSSSYLEHSTPRENYSADAEPRQYYDVDFGTFSSNRQFHTRDGRHQRTEVPLTKVNSETYLMTPVGLQSSLHGSISMGDVRDLDESNQSLTEMKLLCRSEERVLNFDNEPSDIPSTRRLIHGNYYSPSSGPIKSMSMPDVANPEDPRLPQRGKKHYKHHENQEDLGDTTLSGSAEASLNVPVRSKTRVPYTIKSHTRSNYDSAQQSRREHHVAFKNLDTSVEEDASDTESVKSSFSGCSASNFRTPSKSTRTKYSRSAATSTSAHASKSSGTSTGGSKPLKALPPSEDLQHMLGQVPDNIHRPVAMVTRHTQMPSPRMVYKRTQQYENRNK